jgi:hypothetical protein
VFLSPIYSLVISEQSYARIPDAARIERVENIQGQPVKHEKELAVRRENDRSIIETVDPGKTELKSYREFLYVPGKNLKVTLDFRFKQQSEWSYAGYRASSEPRPTPSECTNWYIFQYSR